ncbi:MAG: NAD(P)H-dependent oxidoreductase subunit E [Sphingobacteriales bacterium]|jgi:[NiFe] hydrogenase diaphorase moiety large subunit|nr:NAD(P)H-dependent oxidoreductase subunit E [Sphingobacteriales bacterium]
MHQSGADRLFEVEPLRSYLLNVLRNIQMSEGYISDEKISLLAKKYDVSNVEVEGVVTFYHFLHRKPTGRHVIYLNNSLTSVIKGYERVKESFERETGALMGSVDRTGTFGLFSTPCIGLSDQEPAALIDFYPFINLNAIKVKDIINSIKQGASPADICDYPADNIRYTPISGSVFFSDFKEGISLVNAFKLSPQEIIEELKKSQLAGRGGAFFPTWMKWDATRKQESTLKFIICNADEGEPGTFKDRVLINSQAASLIEGMIIGGYTAGASYGIIYLRGEYFWLAEKLNTRIQAYYQKGLLGKTIGGKDGFNFDLRIQMGAGAYVCGEETALLESMEGKRGEPRTKWFLPVEKGYLQMPTIINNVETFCAVARIFEKGLDNYCEKGIPGSPGTKIISVSGDCSLPGIYEIEWGMTVAELLELGEANDPYFIQVSGPSGECISMKEKYRRISMLDLLARKDIRCGGALTVYNSQRDLIMILSKYAEFFKHESCGICTPCRAGNYLIERKLDKLRNGLASREDLENIRSWANIMKASSRCGLGKTAPNSIILAMEKFAEYFYKRLYHTDNQHEGIVAFDMEAAISDYEKYKN